jgi:hypothetical protein
MLRGQPLGLFVAVGILAYLPVHSTIMHAQPNILVAVALAAGFLAAEGNKVIVASLLLAFASAKPQWSVLPGLAFLRNRPTALPYLAVIGGILLLAPFLLLGAGVILDYIRLVTGRAGVDTTEAHYSTLLVNWLGFFRASTGSPQPVLGMIASLVTLAVFGMVLRRGERDLTWAAAIFTTLIVSPHVHGSEWALAIPGAALLLRRPMGRPMIATTVFLLLLVHTGATAANIADTSVYLGGRFIYWAVPAAFSVVVWCAILPFLEGRLSVMTRHHIAIAAEAS